MVFNSRYKIRQTMGPIFSPPLYMPCNKSIESSRGFREKASLREFLPLLEDHGHRRRHRLGAPIWGAQNAALAFNCYLGVFNIEKVSRGLGLLLPFYKAQKKIFSSIVETRLRIIGYCDCLILLNIGFCECFSHLGIPHVMFWQ